MKKGNRWVNPVLLVFLLGAVALCYFVPPRDVSRPNYEFLPEAQMVQSPAYDSFAPNPNFADGLTLRTPPPGAIARGSTPLHYLPTLEDALRAGEELKNPFPPLDTARRERGTTVFTNFCQVCHGPLGQGNGPVTQGGFPPPASLLADRAVQMKDGQMFHVLTYGQGNMPSVAAQLSVDDRWSVILHMRMLQGPYAPGAAATRTQKVAKLFNETCAACHGPDGTGGPVRKILPLIPNFTSLAWQMSQTEVAIVNQIDYGTAPMMPAFRYRLTREQVVGLAVYVRSFAAHQPGAPPAAAPPSHLTAAYIYGTSCFVCHDTTGKVNATFRITAPELPDFTSTAWQKSRTDADLAQSILQGKGKFMLPRKAELGSVDVKDMVALMRRFEGGKYVVPLEVAAPLGSVLPPTPGAAPPTVPPPTGISEEEAARVRVGMTIFRQFCFTCHGTDGTGSLMRPSMPQIPDFTSEAFQADKQRNDVRLRVSILDGRGPIMQPNRGRVTEDQARDLVAYVRTFGPAIPVNPGSSDAGFSAAVRRLEKQLDDLHKQLQDVKGKP